MWRVLLNTDLSTFWKCVVVGTKENTTEAYYKLQKYNKRGLLQLVDEKNQTIETYDCEG